MEDRCEPSVELTAHPTLWITENMGGGHRDVTALAPLSDQETRRVMVSMITKEQQAFIPQAVPDDRCIISLDQLAIPIHRED